MYWVPGSVALYRTECWSAVIDPELALAETLTPASEIGPLTLNRCLDRKSGCCSSIAMWSPTTVSCGPMTTPASPSKTIRPRASGSCDILMDPQPLADAVGIVSSTLQVRKHRPCGWLSQPSLLA